MKRLCAFGRIAALATTVLVVLQAPAQAQVVDDLAALVPADVRADGVITIGAPRTIPPHVYLDGDNLTGVAVDVAAAMGEMLDLDVEWVDMQWPGIIPGIQSGAIDASIGLVSYRPDRVEILNMIPYVNDALAMLVSTDNTDITSDEATMCGRRVGVAQASWFFDLATAASERCVAAGSAPIDILQFASNAALQAAYQSGSIDAWLHTAVELAAIKAVLGDGTHIVPLEGDAWATGAITIALSKDQPELAEAVRAAFQTLIDDGRYQAILDEYGIGDLGVSAAAINP